MSTTAGSITQRAAGALAPAATARAAALRRPAGTVRVPVPAARLQQGGLFARSLRVVRGQHRRALRCRASDEADAKSPEDWAEVAKQLQKQAEERMNTASMKLADATKEELSYMPPEQRMREMEKEAALEMEGLPNSMELFSPSKINVFLRIIRRREDGFHDLASLFHMGAPGIALHGAAMGNQVIDFGDMIKFSKAPPGAEKDSLTTDHPDVPLDDTNLINRAFKLFREKTGETQYFWVHLKKKVPAGAGLGGGSGNAATALWAANEMCGTKIPEETLMEWSGELGSDCPIFFSQGAAYCTGRGEIVENLEPMLSLDTPMLLVKPNLFCSTPAIFKALDLDSRSTADPLKLLADLTEKGISPELTVNDLEQPAFANLPELEMLQARLTATAKGKFSSVWMSGSGSTIVCWGSLDAPQFLYEEDEYEDVMIQPARLLTRKPGKWYSPHQGESNMFGMGDKESYGEGMSGREWLDKAGFVEEK